MMASNSFIESIMPPPRIPTPSDGGVPIALSLVEG